VGRGQQPFLRPESETTVRTGRLLLCCIFALAAGLALPAALVAAAPDQSVVGFWLGTLRLPSADVAIIFHLSTTPDGKLEATLDVPDQGAQGLAVDSTVWTEGVLRLEIKFIDVVFEGRIAADGHTLEGSLVQGGKATPLTLQRVEKVPERARPQEPKKPYPYREEEVTFENALAGVKLAGTLTTPTLEEPFPAVVLISGSGPQDRDSTFMGHRSFLVLADYLTRRGIAVLRVDDRGVGRSTGDRTRCTSQDYADDSLAGVAYLLTRKETNPRQVGLIGHSEGGMLAAMAAAKCRDVAFIVSMAGDGVPGEQVCLLQSELTMRADGASEEAVAAYQTLLASVYAVVKEEPDNTVAAERIRQVMQEWHVQHPGGSHERAVAEIEAMVGEVLTPWFRYQLTYDPRPALEKVSVPVLATNGALDLQVPAKQNLSAMEQALRAGGNRHYVVKELPGLNHLFQTAKTGSPNEYAGIEETMSPLAMETVADWVLQVCAR
jgi:pimeloyl-ACP methyl ester carboxylesterase